jgi:hypothetical protein
MTGGNMRPRKNRITLSLDNLTANMIPGKTYTAAKLSCIFDASPPTIAEMLNTLTVAGRMETSLASKGRRPDRREERRIYWVAAYTRVDVASRRIAPSEIKGELRDYDLMSHQRLCLQSRKS